MQLWLCLHRQIELPISVVLRSNASAMLLKEGLSLGDKLSTGLPAALPILGMRQPLRRLLAEIGRKIQLLLDWNHVKIMNGRGIDI